MNTINHGARYMGVYLALEAAMFAATSAFVMVAAAAMCTT